jgi:hypothetical protein
MAAYGISGKARLGRCQLPDCLMEPTGTWIETPMELFIAARARGRAGADTFRLAAYHLLAAFFMVLAVDCEDFSEGLVRSERIDTGRDQACRALQTRESNCEIIFFLNRNSQSHGSSAAHGGVSPAGQFAFARLLSTMRHFEGSIAMTSETRLSRNAPALWARRIPSNCPASSHRYR